MNLVILIGLALIGILLAARGGMGLLGNSRRMSGHRRPVLPLVGAALSFVGLLVGWSAGLPVPVGYAGGAGGLLLDPLGCVFSLLLMLTAAWCDADGSADQPEAGAANGLRDLRVAAIMLTLLAGDAFLLACGACLAILVPQRLLGRRSVRGSVLAAFAIAGACSLLSGLSATVGGLLADPGFVLLRAGGGNATLVLPLLVIVAAMPLLGLWPAQNGFRHQCAFAPVWVPVTGMLLGQFILIRLLLDLAGPVPSPQWGAWLVVLGAGSAMRAGVAGLAERRASGVIGSVLSAQNGLCVVAIGLCLLARCNDLPVLAGSALDAVLLLVPTTVLGGLSCLALVRAMESEAGSGLLSRLGGLVRSMPLASALLLLPVALLGAVPPLAGFVVLWLLVQLVLATPLPMLAGIAVPSLLLLLLIAAAAALNGACLLRVCSIALLGRPRTPRGAAATDLDRARLRRHLAVLSVPVLIGLVPGGWLRLAAGPAASGIEAPRHPLFWIDAPAGNAVLSPLPVAILLVVCLLAGVLFARRLTVRVERRQRGWADGAPPPPPWLPFGDPATQIAPATLAMSLRQALAPATTRLLPMRGRFRFDRLGQARISLGRRLGAAVRSALVRHAPVLAALVVAGALLFAAGGVFASAGPTP